MTPWLAQFLATIAARRAAKHPAQAPRPQPGPGPEPVPGPPPPEAKKAQPAPQLRAPAPARHGGHLSRHRTGGLEYAVEKFHCGCVLSFDAEGCITGTSPCSALNEELRRLTS